MPSTQGKGPQIDMMCGPFSVPFPSPPCIEEGGALSLIHIYTLVEARWVIPVIPRNTVLENHTVVFSGGRIADILPTEAARVRYAGLEAKTMRLPAGVVMPGLINLHTHAAMNLLRGRGADLPLMDWLTKEIWPAEGRLMSAEFVHDGSLIAGIEMIRSGVTCCSDLYFLSLIHI